MPPYQAPDWHGSFVVVVADVIVSLVALPMSSRTPRSPARWMNLHPHDLASPRLTVLDTLSLAAEDAPATCTPFRLRALLEPAAVAIANAAPSGRAPP